MKSGSIIEGEMSLSNAVLEISWSYTRLRLKYTEL